MKHSAASFAESFQKNNQLCDKSLSLSVGECGILIRSNSEQLLARLSRYFNHVRNDTASTEIEVIAIEQAAPDLPLPFLDWPREPGKTGRKDAHLDIEDGRLVQKVRTGMLFLQSEKWKIAFGPCLGNDNQVINFINSQYMNWLQQSGWLICHAAGISYNGRGLAMAGFSGGGKSTLMLKLLDHEKVNYLTNDRLFIRRNEAGIVLATGIPKLPRINPGTIINNPKLKELISADRQQALRELSADDLWNLDEKYDIYIDQVYGKNRIVQQTPLNALMVLNWNRRTSHNLHIRTVDVRERPDLLNTIMKSPGPFYQNENGSFLSNSEPFERQTYLDALYGVPIFEAYGGVDFQGLSEHCMRILNR